MIALPQSELEADLLSAELERPVVAGADDWEEGEEGEAEGGDEGLAWGEGDVVVEEVDGEEGLLEWGGDGEGNAVVPDGPGAANKTI